MTAGTIVADDHDGEETAELVTGHNEATSRASNFEAFFDSGDNGGNIAGTKSAVDEYKEAYGAAEPFRTEPGVGVSYFSFQRRRRLP